MKDDRSKEEESKPNESNVSFVIRKVKCTNFTIPILDGLCGFSIPYWYEFNNN